MYFAGFPTHTSFAGTSFVTTAPMPTIARSPIFAWSRMQAEGFTIAPSPISHDPATIAFAITSTHFPTITL